MKKEKIVLLVITLIVLLGCFYIYIYAESEDIPPPYDYNDCINLIREYDEHYLLFRCVWQDITYCINQSEFCVMADVIEKSTSINKFGHNEKGKLKVKSIIYGNPETDEIPFSYNYSSSDCIYYNGNAPWVFERFPNTWCQPFSSGSIVHFLYSEPTSIVLGKGKGKDVKILRAIGESTGLISVDTIKECKKAFNDDPYLYYYKSDITKNLLINSNNRELLCLLFSRLLPQGKGSGFEAEKGTNLSPSVDLIKTLAIEGIDTPQRRFLVYGMSLFLLYEFKNQPARESPLSTLNYPDGSRSVFKNPFAEFTQLNENQREILIDIAVDKFSRINSTGDGIKYLRLIGLFSYPADINYRPGLYYRDFIKNKKIIMEEDSKLFEHAPGLKDKLQPIALSLSKQFKDGKDYPEWQKWVNKIFPPE